MWDKKSFIEEENLLYVLGEEYMEENDFGDYDFPEDTEALLARVWKEYKRQDWLNHGFYKVRGKVFDVRNDLNGLSKEVSKATFVKVCKELDIEEWEYSYYI